MWQPEERGREGAAGKLQQPKGSDGVVEARAEAGRQQVRHHVQWVTAADREASLTSLDLHFMKTWRGLSKGRMVSQGTSYEGYCHALGQERGEAVSEGMGVERSQRHLETHPWY